MPISSAKRLVHVTIIFAMMMTSLAQPTDEDQYQDRSGALCGADVMERLDDVTRRLASLQRDVTAALRATPAELRSNDECDGSNMAQLQSEMTAIRQAIQLTTAPHHPLSNDTCKLGKLNSCLPVVALFQR